MNTNLQNLAKAVINYLFKKGYTPSEIKDSLDNDPRFKDEKFIFKDVAEAVSNILSEKIRIYHVQIILYDSEDNELEKSSVLGCNEKEINKMIDEIVGKTNGISYGKISKYLSIT